MASVNLDPQYLRQQAAASYRKRGWEATPEELDYAVSKASHPEAYSDGKTRVGWNGYWDARFSTPGSASADPRLAGDEGVIGMNAQPSRMPRSQNMGAPWLRQAPGYGQPQTPAATMDPGALAKLMQALQALRGQTAPTAVPRPNAMTQVPNRQAQIIEDAIRRALGGV